MLKRDLLKEVYDGKLTDEEAADIFEQYLDESRVEWGHRDALMLSHYELTAERFAPFSAIAKWRYEGWPQRCPICGGKIVIENYGWEADRSGSELGLQHIQCRWARQRGKPIPKPEE